MKRRRRFYKEIKINQDKKTVVAINSKEKYFAVGVAKCHPNDNFNEDIGKFIAITKMEINWIKQQVNYYKKMEDAHLKQAKTFKRLNNEAKNKLEFKENELKQYIESLNFKFS